MIIQKGVVRTDFIACPVNHKTQPIKTLDLTVDIHST